MNLFKLLFWVIWGAVATLLFNKKSWKALRNKLKWKKPEDQAKLIWNELLELWNEIVDSVKDLSDSEQVQEFCKLWKTKLKKVIKEAKAEWNDFLNEHLPKLEKALKECESSTKKTVKTAKKTIKKKANAAKKSVTKTVKKAKKTITKKVKK